ncbi:hypothetical protein MHW47_29485 [Streptomyces sp. OfavH-34-F]|uniref:hypothetical protein n=1 Tax=Streptomyces sp. OfavH-34-F TaxID=2917760 RepID=UPI001EF2E5EC|nr:hypothetical protein [Streptomyces sp. OfavH-34-F]MCG7528562.1 hypothetical protein [Streptomyces sp. OfavH-34-F]
MEDHEGGGATAALWHNLADALNALAAGLHPDFHDHYGPENNWRHQPVVSSSHGSSQWVVLDQREGEYTVTTRERTLAGEHSRPRRRKRR